MLSGNATGRCVVWLCLFAPALPGLPYPPQGQYAFDQYGQEQGLGSSLIYTIAQDGDGFLWVGTRVGLFRFDGLRFQLFGEKEGLANLHVRALEATRDGSLWVITDNGLARKKGSRFEAVPWPTPLRGQPPYFDNATLASDAVGRLYVATRTGVYRESAGGFERLQFGAGDEAAWGVFAQGDGVVWAGCGEQICRLAGGKVYRYAAEHGVPADRWAGFARDGSGTLWARGTDKLLRLTADSSRFEAVPGQDWSGSTQLLTDHKGRLLVPTRKGIHIWTPSGTWMRITHSNGLAGDDVNWLLEDREASLWIGFADFGVARWRGRGEWTNYTKERGLLSNVVRGAVRDASGDLWVGTDSGLSRYSPSTGQWRGYTRREGLSGTVTRDITRTPDGIVWAAFNDAGLTRIDPAAQSIHPVSANEGLTSVRIISLHAEPDGTLWVCTRDGVFRKPPGSAHHFDRMFARELDDAEQVYGIRRDSQRRLWLAGNRGLRLYDGETWKHFGLAEGLRSETLAFLETGPDDSIWIGYGTYQDGVAELRYHHGALELQHFDRGKPLHSSDVCFLGRDRRGWIWVGTDNGVDVFNGTQWRHLSTHDGLIWHDTVLNAFYEDIDGSIWIGSHLGLSHYRPGDQTFGSPPPPVAITSMRVGGQLHAIEPGKLRLPWGARSFQVGFAALTFARRDLVRYRYRLLGLDPVWVETSESEAAFPQLPHGKYRFEVQASAGGPWSSSGPSVSFEVMAPWWRHPLSQAALLLGLLALAWLIHRGRLQHVGGQKRELERAVAERTRELEAERDLTNAEKLKVEEQKREIEELLQKATEASRLKSEFLANISHEIRTPMNGILGMTSLALDTHLSSEQREYLETAKTSGEALLALLNDILDYSKIEAHRLELECVPFSLTECVSQVVRGTSWQAAKKNLDLRIRLDVDIPESVNGDPTRLRQVLLNLLTNAIKFTDHGWILLEADLDGKVGEEVRVHFRVTDTGIGIPADKQGVIFEAFRQVDGSTTRKHGGTGLGLAICTRLVAMMNGRLWVWSEPDQGSTFHFTAGFRAAPAAPTPVPGLAMHQLTSLASVIKNGGKRNLRVLVAEDNAVNQRLLVRLLEKLGHQVDVAEDGNTALRRTSERHFDLVIMDVQMPGIDGLEATRQIRDQERRSGGRLAILIITAHAMAGDREKCLEAGADSYLPKPVNPEQLAAAIEAVVEGSPSGSRSS